MVTRTGKQKARKRNGVKLKALEASGIEMLREKGPVVDAGPSLYLVPSMSSDSYHEVRHLVGIWSCDCPYYMSGHTVCKHICAARATLLMREVAASAMEKTCVEDPQIRCPGCGLAVFHESTTYMTRGGRPPYTCATTPRAGRGSPRGRGLRGGSPTRSSSMWGLAIGQRASWSGCQVTALMWTSAQSDAGLMSVRNSWSGSPRRCIMWWGAGD